MKSTLTDYDTPPETPELRSDRLQRNIYHYPIVKRYVFSSSIESLNSTLSHNSNNNEIRNGDLPSPATLSTNGQEMVSTVNNPTATFVN